MKTLLVTGARGQLGQELQGLSYTHVFRDYRFLFTDVDTLDITNAGRVEEYIAKNGIDCVINCASYTNVDKAETEQDAAMLINGTAPGLLAGACAGKGAFLVHVGTDFVFDGERPVPYREEDNAAPISSYGRSKLEGDRAVLAYERGTVVRTSWLYSSYGHNFFRTIHRLAHEKDELSVVYDQAGTPTYARDLARVLLLLAVNSLSGKGSYGKELFHYSNEGVCSWYDFALEIITLTGIQCRVKPVETEQYPLPARRPRYSVMSKSKIRSRLEIDIPHWKESLRNCISQLD
ncbi:MAG: dTDP-4-dehydrorhamnose reductase [Marinilabiliales bacterium]|nr:MAG: dTDP-4-dehydrorhamnose reductase [Marinilabiliales bacterium]